MPRVKKVIDPSRTEDQRIRSALRLLWMRSKEKNAAERREKNTCEFCGLKKSVAKGKEVKIEVHHKKPGDINWPRIYEVIREELLCDVSMLQVLCKPCHYTHHGKKVPKERKK